MADSNNFFLPPGVSQQTNAFEEDFPEEYDIPDRLRFARADTIEVVNDWHFAMMNDRARNEAYQRAIEKTITPESIVVEIGAGSGILSIMAAKAGAKKVYAIEGSKHFVDIARQNVKTNGVEDVVEVIHGMSTEVTLPERATVLLGEILGTMMDGESATEFFFDAQERLCEPNAAVIPARGTQYATLIQSDALRSVSEVKDSHLKLSAFNRFRDSASVIKSKLLGATLRAMNFQELSEKMTVYEVDWQEGRHTIEDTKAVRVESLKDGCVTAIMYWWEVEMDVEGECVMSTHPWAEDGSLMRDVQWGQGITLVEDPKNWSAPQPKMLHVKEGEKVVVQFDMFGFIVNGRVVPNDHEENSNESE